MTTPTQLKHIRRPGTDTLVNWIRVEGLTIGIYEEAVSSSFDRYTIAIAGSEDDLGNAPRIPFAKLASSETPASSVCGLLTMSMSIDDHACSRLWEALESHGAEPYQGDEITHVLKDLLWMWVDGTTTEDEVAGIIEQLGSLDATVGWLR